MFICVAFRNFRKTFSQALQTRIGFVNRFGRGGDFRQIVAVSRFFFLSDMFKPNETRNFERVSVDVLDFDVLSEFCRNAVERFVGERVGFRFGAVAFPDEKFDDF